jgi:hypothetical protein
MFIHFSPATADLVILAIDARQVTPAEKHVAYPVFPAYNRFFAMMCNNRTDVKSCVAATNTGFALQAVYITIPGTYSAGSHLAQQFIQSLFG